MEDSLPECCYRLKELRTPQTGCCTNRPKHTWDGHQRKCRLARKALGYDLLLMSQATKFLAVALIVFLIVALTWRAIRARSRPQTPHASSGKDVYLNLRAQILELTGDKCGLPAAAEPMEPCVTLMDWGVTSGTATVVAVADGTV